MGWLDTIMFWRRKDDEPSIEHLDGFEVDGCFTLPGARLDDIAPVDEAPNDDDGC